MTHEQSQAIHASNSLGALVALLVQAKYQDDLVATFADAHNSVTFAVAALRRYEQKAAA